MRWAPHTDDDVQEMLAASGLATLDDLYAHLPAGVVLDRDLDIPAGLSEMELLAEVRRLAARNRHADDLVCFAGGGAYDHYVPAVVWALTGRSEIYTSYTPYQPELSQGILQALFEYQSLMCELTGLEVSNASLYDGATALVEAVHMAVSATKRQRVLVSDALDRRYVETLRTSAAGEGFELEVLAAAGGRTTVPGAGAVEGAAECEQRGELGRDGAGRCVEKGGEPLGAATVGQAEHLSRPLGCSKDQFAITVSNAAGARSVTGAEAPVGARRLKGGIRPGGGVPGLAPRGTEEP